MQAADYPTYAAAFRFWFKLGWISFGGPAGQISIMHDELVDRRKWISNSRFLHALNYCMLLPGPEAQQLAIYIGWLLHGVKGGLTAGMLFILPSVLILLGLSLVYVTWGSVPWIQALFSGLKPAVVAIILCAVYKIGSKSLVSATHVVTAVLSFSAMFFLKVPFPLILLSAALFALILKWKAPALLHASSGSAKKQESEEAGFLLNATNPAGDGFQINRFLRQLAITLVFWGMPLLIFLVLFTESGFWIQLSTFFTQAALVTFGGAYAVLPYVAQVTVQQLGWLSPLQMVDGLALGETTPGPLIMVLAFVGFMAGYNLHDASVVYGTLALLTTVWFTFLPGFFFIFAGAPVIERTRDNPAVKAILTIISAAVVGVILNLALFLGQEVLFPSGVQSDSISWFPVGWMAISLLALIRYKVNLILWIGISALAGLAAGGW
ncbi:MAG: chromate efflux transporter [Bacteroidetes bacterium]|nr:chromate efflux transporter [Bacteroidota bacterium]